jgi:lycopene beta-cyclase
MIGVDYDAVISGGGLSGLSLAAHLSAAGWGNHRVLIVDDPHHRPMATCWAWWSAAPGLLDAAVSRSFTRVRVHAAGASRVLSLGGYRYRVVQRAALRRTVLPMLAECRFELAPGHIELVRDAGDHAEVVVDGEVIRAGWVFDSVGAGTHHRDVNARLAFTGYEVHTGRPMFDPNTPVLLDFRTPQAAGARFAYVLPLNAHRAIVDLTEFVPRRVRPPDDLQRREALDRYLCEVIGSTDHQILRTEAAVIGLRPTPEPRRSGRVVTIGARAGLIKASTGYAYQRIQRDSAAMARSLVRHGHPNDVPRSRLRHRLMDALLLDVLNWEPAQLEISFADLFAAIPAERILRFLDEDTHLYEELALTRAMPARPYLRALAGRVLRPHM